MFASREGFFGPRLSPAAADGRANRFPRIRDSPAYPRCCGRGRPRSNRATLPRCACYVSAVQIPENRMATKNHKITQKSAFRVSLLFCGALQRIAAMLPPFRHACRFFNCVPVCTQHCLRACRLTDNRLSDQSGNATTSDVRGQGAQLPKASQGRHTRNSPSGSRPAVE